MDNRREELTKLKSYTEDIDNKLTLILQTLQWDRKHLLQCPEMVTCKYDSNHKVPPDKTEEHEKECFLRKNGYTKDNQLLPDPLDSESNTVVKLKKEDIEQIIANASRSDVSFKKGVGCRGAEPLSLDRLQMSYSADERRAIHDAVVNAVPSCHDLTDLALFSAGHDESSKVILSRTEILVQLRDMRRRRTKYRVAAKSRNYSDVLRDVIRTQMDHYNEGKTETTTKETADEENDQRETHNDRRHSRQASQKDDRYIYDRYGKTVPRPIANREVKIEREDSTERNRDYSRGSETTPNETAEERHNPRDTYNHRKHSRRTSKDDRYTYDRDRKLEPRPIGRREIKTEREDTIEGRDYSRERSDKAYRYEMGSKDGRDRDSDRRGRNHRSGESRNDEHLERPQKYGEHSRKRRHDNDSVKDYDQRDKTREKRNYREESKERRKDNDPDNEYRSEKSPRFHRHRDVDLGYQVKKETAQDEESNNPPRESSRKRRHEENRDKTDKHKDNRRRDRERSRDLEKRQDHRYGERFSEGIHIKLEREDSVTSNDGSNNEKAKDRSRKSNDSRYDRSYRDRNYESNSSETKREKHARYYDRPEEIYDPNKKIKEEK